MAMSSAAGLGRGSATVRIRLISLKANQFGAIDSGVCVSPDVGRIATATVDRPRIAFETTAYPGTVSNPGPDQILLAFHTSHWHTSLIACPSLQEAPTTHTMGAGHAPYLYDPPSRRQIAYPYSDFDPKAVTRASWISAAESTMSKPKQEGPLIDFNRHPDSYMVVTPHAPREPLPPNTKKKVVAWRWVQFGLRISQLLGAIGLLLCVIFVRNTETAQGWIMRVPVSIRYSLLRSAIGRD